MIKKINGYENYYITSFGEVLSLKGGRTKVLKPSISKSGEGYYQVVLSKKGCKQKCVAIHRLVAEHFLTGYQEGYVVDHRDRNQLNNSLENLRWVSKRENKLNSDKHIVRPQVERKKLKGAYPYGKSGKFYSCITVSGKKQYLGLFNTEEEASQAYLEAKKKFHLFSV